MKQCPPLYLGVVVIEKEAFGSPSTKVTNFTNFYFRYNCFNLRKQEDQYFVGFAGNVNQQCERFNLKDLSIDMLKCLVFVLGLTANRDKDIRWRIFNKMEQDPDITLQKITEEC